MISSERQKVRGETTTEPVKRKVGQYAHATLCPASTHCRDVVAK